MARGGYRAGSGRPPGTKKNTPKVDKAVSDLKSGKTDGDDGLTPKDFLLSVMADKKADLELRVRVAGILMPFTHAKVEAAGKKEQRNAAAKDVAEKSKFAPGAPPGLKVVK